METTLTFGQWLRRRRKTLDLTQNELAARVPCAKGTIRRLETDDLRPSKTLAERLVVVLDVPESTQAAFVQFARTGFDQETFLQDVGISSNRYDNLPPAPATPRRDNRYTLPAAPNLLLGRLHAVGVAVELLSRPDVRLVTLLGPPGVGKTRLALQVAEEMQTHFRDGACFVPLAPLQDAGHVLAAMAQAIELLDSGRPLAAALVDRLRGEETLLVLDNVEHVIAAAADIAELLSAVPTLKLICTSRVALRIPGEHEFVVSPLALPDLTQLPSSETWEANPAVSLFIARAKAAHTSFTVSDENWRHIAEICHRLDGLPLAIELAATRCKLFPPAALLTRLDRRLPLLTGGTRTAPARQRTLEAAIAWSYDLLNEIEKVCLAQLAIFWGGWTLESAQIICDLTADMIELLSSLRDQSLVQVTHEGQNEGRFTMLETIREFALLRLDEQGKTNTLQARHAHYFLSLAVASEKGLQGREQVNWMRRLHAEQDNLRAALTWSLAAQGDIEAGLKAGAALWWYWWTNGQVSEGRQWFRLLLQEAAEKNLDNTISYGQALLGAGILAFFAGDFAAAQPQFDTACALSLARNDMITHGYATFMIGTVAILSGQPESGQPLIEQGSTILQEVGDAAAWHIGVTSLARTLLTFEHGQLDEAQHHANMGMKVFRQLGQPYGIGLAFNYQGDVARLRGDHQGAAEKYQAALPLLHEAKAQSEIPAVLHNLAHVYLMQANVQHAQTLFAEGLQLHREIGNRMGVVECLIGLASVAIAMNQPQRAATLSGVIDTLLVQLDVAPFVTEQAIYQQAVDGAKGSLNQPEWDLAYRAGQAMPLTEALNFAAKL